MKLDRFSLEHIVSGSSQAVKNPPFQDVALDQATIVYSEPILRVLQEAENKRMPLHDLIKKVNSTRPVSSYEEFHGVIDRLVSLGFIEILQRDLRGNHLVHLLRES